MNFLFLLEEDKIKGKEGEKEKKSEPIKKNWSLLASSYFSSNLGFINFSSFVPN